MFAAYVALTIILAALLCYAASRKLSHRADVVASYARVGVPEPRLDLLAALLLAGAAGLIAGLFQPLAGLAAAAGLTAYFLVAIAAHVRFRDTANVRTPIVLALFAAASFLLRLLTA